jgi:hypothetical protein
MMPTRHAARFLTALAVVAGVSCGDVARQSRAPVYLVIERLEAVAGGLTGTFAGTLLSDVRTSSGVFNDGGRAVFRLSLKDIGTPTAPSTPTSNHEVTITRYRVVYRRADGRNTPGVDVPYPFDGGVTVTVPRTGNIAVTFELVRHAAKEEPPLSQLVANGATLPPVISTVTDVTFYGRDQVGNEVSATGSILIDFGDFADPAAEES